jgi:hypothetical protein
LFFLQIRMFGLASTAMLAKADNRSSDPGSVRGSEKREIEDWSFKSLDGTQKERDELIKQFAGWGWTLSDFTKKKATKEALLKIHSPYILHLATHGFFAKEDPTTAQTEPESSLKDRQGVTKSSVAQYLNRRLCSQAIHDLNAVNGHSLRFKCRATASAADFALYSPRGMPAWCSSVGDADYDDPADRTHRSIGAWQNLSSANSKICTIFPQGAKMAPGMLN